MHMRFTIDVNHFAVDVCALSEIKQLTKSVSSSGSPVRPKVSWVPIPSRTAFCCVV